MQSVPISIKIEPGLKFRIQNLAEMTDKSPHRLMKEAISDFVDREEKRERFRLEANEASRDYSQTGLHLEQAEVFAWLDTWGTENETEAPACHK